MRIHGNARDKRETGRVQQDYVRSPAPGDQLNEIPDEELKLTNTRPEIERLARLAKQVPDVRMDRVEELRQAIFDGTYSVEPEDVADKLIQHMSHAKK